MATNATATVEQEIEAVPSEDETNKNIVIEAQQRLKSVYAMPDFYAIQTRFDEAIIQLAQSVPFYAHISRHINKIPSFDLPTAGVMIHPRTDELCLLWNPEFIKGLTQGELMGLLIHEYSHVIFLHLTLRHRKHSDWNIALDLAINSLILEMNHSYSGSGDRALKLPEGCWAPGYPLVVTAERLAKMTDKEKEQQAYVSSFVEKLPKLLASEHYFMLMQKDRQDNPDKWPGSDEEFEIVFGPGIDDHSYWSNMSEEKKEKIIEKVRSIVQKGKQIADSQSNGWGSIPSAVVDAIRAFANPAVNWKEVLKNFIGSLIRAKKSRSFKRHNRKFPFVHPGQKQAYAPKLLLAVDQSGSVSDEMLGEFFVECDRYLTSSKMSFSYLPFDCEALEEDIQEYRSGKKFDYTRHRAGGTDFNAPTAIFNDPKNAGRWDGMLILTDGEAPQPELCKGKRGWIIARGQKLYFDTNELVIEIADEGTTTRNGGSWY